MELHPPQHLGVVAIEKGAFGLPSTKVANFTYKDVFGINQSTKAVMPLIKEATLTSLS